MGRLLWLVLVVGCTDHTYTVGVDGVAQVDISFAQPDIHGGGLFDIVRLGFVNAAPTSAGCPVLADDAVVKLGDTPLTGTRGGYDDGWSPDSAESGPPYCVEAYLKAPSQVSAPDTIDLVLQDGHTQAHVTVVAPYVQRTLVTPSALVPGTTARLVWAPATDSPAMPASIDCVDTNPGSQQSVVTAPLSYAGGELTFAVPSQPSYHGALTCYLVLSMMAEVTDCSGLTTCTAYPGSGGGTQFATSI